jgi:hypothetical protein
MKKNFVLLAFIASFVFISCEKQIADGDWPPIKVNKEKLYFPKEGGEETIFTLNYKGWWFSDRYSPELTTFKGEDGHTYEKLDGGWYTVTMCRKPNSAVIQVQKNDTETPRQAIFHMTVGDSFKSIWINQE